MSKWTNLDESSPPTEQLVLVYQELTGHCLRALSEDGYWYDENEDLDDSELFITHWAELLEAPE